MPCPPVVALPVGGQLLEAVGADGLQHPVVDLVPILHALQDGLVDEPGDEVEDLVAGDAVAGADRLGGREVQPPGEHTAAFPQPLLGRGA